MKLRKLFKKNNPIKYSDAVKAGVYTEEEARLLIGKKMLTSLCLLNCTIMGYHSNLKNYDENTYHAETTKCDASRNAFKSFAEINMQSIKDIRRSISSDLGCIMSEFWRHEDYQKYFHVDTSIEECIYDYLVSTNMSANEFALSQPFRSFEMIDDFYLKELSRCKKVSMECRKLELEYKKNPGEKAELVQKDKKLTDPILDDIMNDYAIFLI